METEHNLDKFGAIYSFLCSFSYISNRSDVKFYKENI